MAEVPELQAVVSRIVELRGQRVMLDYDLAALYGVPTERLNEQVRRNKNRFPADFIFRITLDEWREMYPQIAGTLRRTRRSDRLPLAFTEHGCLMASNVLRSTRAAEVSVLIVRAFVRMRSALAASTELALQVEKLSREVERQGGTLAGHHGAIQVLLDQIRRLTQFPETPKRSIGFTAPWQDSK
jgi:hypothetical protein